MEAKPLAVRIAKCHDDQHLYYITFNGDLYRIDEVVGQPATDVLIASEPDHGINFLQGLAMGDSMMFLCGNHKEPGAAGWGIVSRGILQQNGSWQWSNLMTTEPYASSATLFDHAFSGICLNPAKDSIFISSGARTDHGEIQVSGGLFPGCREVPLTTAIFRLPVNANGLILQNDSAWLDSSGFLFARGFRNAFDIAFDKNGNLFGVEHSGDRDDPDELNLIQQNRHYGFPWVMGGNLTGQQLLSYDPLTDLLINHGSLAWQNNFFYNDSTYPQMPPGLVITPGLRNSGPDADVWRNPLTGTVINTSDSSGFDMRTFTSHKSPLGLVFDNTNSLDSNYNGDGYVLGYTRGCSDSSGFITGYGLAPALDIGEDLLQLKFELDTFNNEFVLTTTRIASGFTNPVDAELIENVMYVIENGYPGDPLIPVIWKLTFPSNTTGINNVLKKERTIYPVPSTGVVFIKGIYPGDRIIVTDLTGKSILKSVSYDDIHLLDLQHIDAGYYIATIFHDGVPVSQEKIIITKH